MAAHIAEQREAGLPQITSLVQIEQGLLAEITAHFPEADHQLLGGLLLNLGNRSAGMLAQLSQEQRPQGGGMLALLFQMAGERLYHRVLPVSWPCPYMLVGGKDCTTVLSAPSDELLEPRIRGHLELHHPEGTRRERRSA